MGWHSDCIGLGSNQRHGLGLRNRCGFFDEFNSDDHDDQSRHSWWLGTSHGDIVTGCCIDSDVWAHDLNGKWFHGADREL